tara:strand:- start:1200 stop:1892 length:693 start_codon:yes stop_codon:yes gene_type:complete
MAKLNKKIEEKEIGPKTEQESRSFIDKDSDKIPDIGVDRYSYAFEGFNDEFFDRQTFQESSFNPKAVSPDNARGLAQITPNTEEELKRLGIVDDNFDPFNPSHAKVAQRGYMDNIYGRDWVQGVNFDGESPEIVKVVKTLMGYNMGPTKAVKFLNNMKENGFDIYQSVDFVEKLNPETKGYVKRILNMNNDPEDQSYYEEGLNKVIGSNNSGTMKFMGGGINPVEELFNN